MNRKNWNVILLFCLSLETVRAEEWVATSAFWAPNSGVTACSVNNLNDMAGATGDRPILFIEGSIYDIGNWFNMIGYATSINDYREAVGCAKMYGSGTSQRAFLYNFYRGLIQDLGTLGGASSGANAINNAGHVVGWAQSYHYGFPQHAFLWDGTDMIDIHPAGAQLSEATDINDLEQVIGRYFDLNGQPHGFLYENGLLTTLIVDGQDFMPFAINNQEQILGGTGLSFSQMLIYQHGQITPLPNLDGAYLCGYYDISDTGIVVGACWYPGGSQSRAVTCQGGVVSDLTRPSWVLAELRAISSDGNMMAGRYSLGSAQNYMMFLFAKLGDMNWDGTVDTFDIDPFILGLIDPLAYRQLYGWDPKEHGDINQNQVFDFFDIDSFIECLLNGGCL